MNRTNLACPSLHINVCLSGLRTTPKIIFEWRRFSQIDKNLCKSGTPIGHQVKHTSPSKLGFEILLFQEEKKKDETQEIKEICIAKPPLCETQEDTTVGLRTGSVFLFTPYYDCIKTSFIHQRALKRIEKRVWGSRIFFIYFQG